METYRNGTKLISILVYLLVGVTYNSVKVTFQTLPKFLNIKTAMKTWNIWTLTENSTGETEAGEKDKQHMRPVKGKEWLR